MRELGLRGQLWQFCIVLMAMVLFMSPELSWGTNGTGGAPLDSSEIAKQATEQSAKDHRLEILPDGRVHIPSPMHAINAIVAPDGMRVISNAKNESGLFTIKPTGLGRLNGAATAILPGVLQTESEFTRIHRPNLIEELTTSSEGIRQDFLVPKAPLGQGDLVLDLSVTGASLNESGEDVMLTLTEGRKLLYRNLVVTDHKGQQLYSHFEQVDINHLRIVVADAGAVYPLRIDPTITDPEWLSIGDLDFENEVFAIAWDGINLYVGGKFLAADGVNANYIAKWDGSSWSSMGSGMDGGVHALTWDGTNLYAGGYFTTAGGVSVNHIAKWDGSAWSALGSGMNNTIVNALVWDGSNLYAGGDFTAAGGVSANYVAKWDGSAWSALGSGLNGPVNALAWDGTNLYAGGYFTTAGVVSANNIANWDGSAWSALGIGMNQYVSVLAWDGTNLYAGGAFTTAGGVSANYVAKWDGSSWSSLGSGMNSAVEALVWSGSNLYAGGFFTLANGNVANYVAFWNGIVWVSLESEMNGPVKALAWDGTNLYAGGRFTSAGGAANAEYIACASGLEEFGQEVVWAPLSTNTGTFNGHVFSLAWDGSSLYVGGSFTTVGNNIAQWDGNTWSPLGSGMNGSVLSLVWNGTRLYAGGQFGTAGGVTAANIAEWDGITWSRLSEGVNNTVRALAWDDVNLSLYVGGSFSHAGGHAGESAAQVAKWDGASWSSLGNGMGVTVYVLTWDGANLYAGGDTIIARWDGNNWSSLGNFDGFLGGGTGRVNALAWDGSNLYAGGLFVKVDELSTNNIAKWDGNTWSALDNGSNGEIRSLVWNDTNLNLYAGGTFTWIGGVSANNVAQWDGSAWSPSGNGMNNGIVNALTWVDPILYAGGGVTLSSGFGSAVASLQVDTPPSPPSNIEVNDLGTDGEVVLSWDNPTDTDFNHIIIYRSTTQGELGFVLVDNLTGLSYVDDTVAENTIYYFTARSVDTTNNESTNDGQVSITTRNFYPPGNPTATSVTDTAIDGEVNLSWTNPLDSDFSCTRIYRSTIEGTLGSSIGCFAAPPGSSDSHLDSGLQNGLTYYYTFRSQDTGGLESQNSTQISVVPTAETNAPVDGYLRAMSGPDKIRLTWSGFSDSESGLDPIDSYILVFSTAYSPSPYCSDGTEISAVTTQNVYTDYQVIPDTTYHYRLCAIDAAGNISFGSLVGATPRPNGWVITDIEPGGLYSSIDVDSSNRAHISHFDDNDFIRYTTNSLGSWSSEIIESGGIGHTSIALDISDKSHISYLDGAGNLSYASNTNGSWAIEIVHDNLANNFAPLAGDTDIAVGNSGSIAMSFYCTENANNVACFASKGSGGWTVNGGNVDSCNLSGEHNSIALTHGNEGMRRTFSNECGELKFASSSFGEEPAIDSGGVGKFNSLFVDSANTMHISYHDENNTTLKYATDDGNPLSWNVETIETGGGYSSIEVDPISIVHISHFDGNNLIHVEGNSGSWSSEIVDYGTGEHSAMALDQFGNPHISYHDPLYNTLKYAFKDISPPTASVLINSGDDSTNSLSVNLTQTCSDGSACELMRFSNDNSTWSGWEPYATTKSWDLLPGVGDETVYVEIMDFVGNITFVSDQISFINTPPSSPNNIEVNDLGTDGEVVLSWTSPTDADFDHIIIYRSTTQGVLGSVLADNLTGLSYVDATVAEYTTYYYTVRSVDTSGSESTNTAQVSVTTSNFPPSSPAGISATDTTLGGEIDLSWTNPANSDFACTNIYRSVVSGELGILVGDCLAGTSVTDTGLENGLTYYYTVRAQDTGGLESLDLTQWAAKPTSTADSTAPGEVVFDGVVDPENGESITLNWTAPASGAGSDDLAYVRIYRDAVLVASIPTLATSPATVGNWTDNGVDGCVTYNYKITTLDSSGNESTGVTFSHEVIDNVPPLPVTGLTATPLTNYVVQLDWNDSADYAANCYNVYHNSASLGGLTQLGTCLSHPSSTPYNTSSLGSSPEEFTFIVRTEASCSTPNVSSDSTVTVTTTADPTLENVCKAWISVPQTGHKVGGNGVTVAAKYDCSGTATLSSIQFEYFDDQVANDWVAISTVSDIPLADGSQFPNPDLTKPYFTRWDVSGAADGDYRLRAVTDTDPNPATTTITIDNANPDVAENTTDGKPTKIQLVPYLTKSSSTMGDQDGTVEIKFEAGALKKDEFINIASLDPITVNKPSADYLDTEVYRDISFDSCATNNLNPDKKVLLEITYKDADKDGFVDNLSETKSIYDLQICNEKDSSWNCQSSVVDATEEKVLTEIKHCSPFGLMVPPKIMDPYWKLVATPLSPVPNDPLSVFGAVNTYGDYVLRYNSTTQVYDQVSTIQPGYSYFIYGNGGNLSVSGTETTQTTFDIPLQKGWNMIGNPFRYNVNLKDMTVTYSGQTVSLQQAETNGWLVGTAFFKEDNCEAPAAPCPSYNVQTVQDGGQLTGWEGYWILSDKDCTLHVPPIPAQ